MTYIILSGPPPPRFPFSSLAICVGIFVVLPLPSRRKILPSFSGNGKMHRVIAWHNGLRLRDTHFSYTKIYIFMIWNVKVWMLWLFISYFLLYFSIFFRIYIFEVFFIQIYKINVLISFQISDILLKYKFVNNIQGVPERLIRILSQIHEIKIYWFNFSTKVNSY